MFTQKHSKTLKTQEMTHKQTKKERKERDAPTILTHVLLPFKDCPLVM